MTERRSLALEAEDGLVALLAAGDLEMACVSFVRRDILRIRQYSINVQNIKFV